MASDLTSNTTSIQQSIYILNRVIQELNEDDPISALAMLGVSLHLLQRLKTDLAQRLSMEKSFATNTDS